MKKYKAEQLILYISKKRTQISFIKNMGYPKHPFSFQATTIDSYMTYYDQMLEPRGSIQSVSSSRGGLTDLGAFIIIGWKFYMPAHQTGRDQQVRLASTLFWLVALVRYQ